MRVANDRGQIVVRRRPAGTVVAQPLPAPAAVAPVAPVAHVAHAAPVHVNPFLRTPVVAQVIFDNRGTKSGRPGPCMSIIKLHCFKQQLAMFC